MWEGGGYRILSNYRGNWIDNDAHEWKNGTHTAKLVVNFKALMDETKAGEENK